MLPSELPKFKPYTNFTFDQIHGANINVQPLEAIDEIHLDDHKFVYYLSIIMLILLAIVTVFQNRYYCLKICKNTNAVQTEGPVQEPTAAEEAHCYPRLPI